MKKALAQALLVAALIPSLILALPARAQAEESSIIDTAADWAGTAGVAGAVGGFGTWYYQEGRRVEIQQGIDVNEIYRKGAAERATTQLRQAQRFDDQASIYLDELNAQRKSLNPLLRERQSILFQLGHLDASDPQISKAISAAWNHDDSQLEKLAKNNPQIEAKLKELKRIETQLNPTRTLDLDAEYRALKEQAHELRAYGTANKEEAARFQAAIAKEQEALKGPLAKIRIAKLVTLISAGVITASAAHAILSDLELQGKDPAAISDLQAVTKAPSLADGASPSTKSAATAATAAANAGSLSN